MANKEKVSMQKIADELNISKVTVSKALTGKGGVSEELKQQIIDLAEKYNYTLRDYGQRKVRKVGVIMSARFTSMSDSGRFYMSMYESILSELRKVACTCVMITPHIETIENDLKILEQDKLFDGLILLGILDEEVRKKVEKIEIPKVYVDIYDESGKYDSVVMESIYSTYELTKYLISMGHRDIGFVGTIGATTSITDRYLGYLRALIEEEIDVKSEWIVNDRTKKGKSIELKLPEVLPTAFVTNCDETAMFLIKALADIGVNVPNDVSIASFDNDIYAGICVPNLTTLAVDLKNIGKVTASKMIQCIESPSKNSAKVHRISGEIIYRDSVKKLK